MSANEISKDAHTFKAMNENCYKVPGDKVYTSELKQILALMICDELFHWLSLIQFISVQFSSYLLKFHCIKPLLTKTLNA